MASVSAYETAKGRRYMVRYRTPDHRPTIKRGFTRKKDAELFAAKLETQLNDGTFVDVSKGRRTVGELAPAWLAKKKIAVKASYYYTLETAWKVHVGPRWAKRSIRSIKRSEIQQWVAGLSSGDEVKPKSASVVIRAYGILAGILDDAKADKLLAENPARGVTLPKRRRKPHIYLTERQLYALSDACLIPGRNRSADHERFQRSVLVLVLGTTGMRWGECIGMRIGLVDFRRHRMQVRVSATEVNGRMEVDVPKTGSERSVVFPAVLDDRLHRLIGGRGPDELLFTGSFHGYVKSVSPKDGGKWFARACDAAGLKRMTIHDLRHTAASLMVKSGANVKAIQRQLGHTSAAMTLDVYADLFDEDLDSVGESMNELLLQSALKVRSKSVSPVA